MKRPLFAAITGIGLVSLLLTLVVSLMFLDHATTHAGGIGDSGVPKHQNSMNKVATTINALTHIAIVGSTAFIVDGKGHTISVDSNPYGVAIAPPSTPRSNVPGTLQAGDIVVTNFGGNNTGKTLVRFPAKKGPGHLFNTMANPGTNGPSDEAFNTMTGTNWVANISANNVQVFRPNGSVLTTLTNPLFHKPWGQAFNHGMRNPKDGAVAAFFSSNDTDATIDRIDIIPTRNGTTFRVTQIGQLTMMGNDTKIALTWLSSLQLKGKKLSDVLLAIDPAKNRIAAYPNSSVGNINMKSTNKGITVFQGAPLAMPGGFTINPLNGDLLVANGQRNDLVELNMSQGKVITDRVIDKVPVDPKTNNGSALFGIVATTDAKNNLEVFFTDDNTNTLNVLSV